MGMDIEMQSRRQPWHFYCARYNWLWRRQNVGHWGTCPRDFQRSNFVSSLQSCIMYHSDFVRLDLQTHLFTVLYRVILSLNQSNQIIFT